MGRRRRFWGVLLLLVAIHLSGCVVGSGEGKAFHPIAAPVWEAGYSWTYQATQVTEQRIQGPEGQSLDSERRHQELTLRVFNTTQPLLQEAAYYVRWSEPMEPNPLVGPAVQALTQSSLALAASDSSPFRILPVPRWVVSAHWGGVLDYLPMDPCAGRNLVRPIEATQQFQPLRFPLEKGHTWTGSLGPLWEGVSYVARVHGLETLKVPAGTFSTVRLSLDFVFPLEASAPEASRVRAHADLWYSPQARHVAKSVFTSSKESGDASSGSLAIDRYEATLELAEFELQPNPAEPAPLIRSQETPMPARHFHLMTDARFPLNIADHSVAATFFLGEVQQAANPGASAPDEVVRFGRGQAPEPPMDPETHEVRWTVTDALGQVQQRAVGDAVVLEFDRGGAYTIRAEVVPRVCGAPWLGSAVGLVTTYWERTFHVPVELGMATVLEIADFPVEAGAEEGLLEWTYDPALAQRLDEGAPRVMNPGGQLQALSEQGTHRAVFGPHVPGSWRLQWDARGPAPLGSPGLPVTVGDDVELLLRVTYDSQLELL